MENEKPYTKIVIFKTRAKSKIILQTFTTTFPKQFIKELEKILRAFLWKNSTQMVERSILQDKNTLR